MKPWHEQRGRCGLRIRSAAQRQRRSSPVCKHRVVCDGAPIVCQLEVDNAVAQGWSAVPRPTGW